MVAVSAVLLVRWQATLSALGNYLVCSQAPQPADVVLVLAGDFYGPRVLMAADLARQGYAHSVLISGTPYQGRPEGEFAIAFLASRGYSTAAFESFGHTAHSTIDEAKVLRGELARRGVKRVILVTSSFHSRRSAIVFRLFSPGVQFISVPAPDPHYNPSGWWLESSSRKLFFSEWTKILGTVLVAYPKDRIRRL
jgi:uncharacterized SAM-binding protein YcdF (DUF218 family)